MQRENRDPARAGGGADRHLECGLEGLLHCRKQGKQGASQRNKNKRERRKVGFIPFFETNNGKKSKSWLTLLHERGELLDGLLRGGRHCRRRSLRDEEEGETCGVLDVRSNGEKVESCLPFELSPGSSPRWSEVTLLRSAVCSRTVRMCVGDEEEGAASCCLRRTGTAKPFFIFVFSFVYPGFNLV